MEQEKSLVRASETRLPKFVEAAYDSIEGMKQFANILLESKLVPDSYYEKGPDNKPDYNKGKTSAVVVVLLQAQQLAVPPMTALQHIVPVNGLLSVKGDLAKTMIFASGKLRKDSWKEVVTGSIEDENMMVSITATRDDNGITLTRTFSVDKAKRMGLWVTAAMAGGQDGWKYKKSAWFKTPDRMIGYRALGNLARDLFSDVLLNMYTTEEATDIAKDTTEIIETEGGAKITIPDKEHAKARSGKMTDRVSDKIPDNKFGAVKENIQDAVVVTTDINQAPEGKTLLNQPEQRSEATKGSYGVLNGEVVINKNNAPAITEQQQTEPEEKHTGKYSLKELEELGTEKLLEMVNGDMDAMEACEMIGGKNTNKKLRFIVYAAQEKNLAEYVAKNLPKDVPGEAPGMETQGDVFNSPEDKAELQQGEIPINKTFDQQGTQRQNTDDFLTGEVKEKKVEDAPVSVGNKYNLVIPPFDKGDSRDFSSLKSLFNALAGLTPSLNNPRYTELATKTGLIQKYADREVFCKLASVTEINDFLNIN